MRNAVILFKPGEHRPWMLWDAQLRTIRQATEKVGYANARDKVRHCKPSFRVGVVMVLNPNDRTMAPQ